MKNAIKATTDGIQTKITQARATIALLKADQHETSDAEKHLKELQSKLSLLKQ